MADGKRYYWLKLHDDFFQSKRIKKLRRMAGGDTYIIIYLKMQLMAMKQDGILRWTGLEKDAAEELALDLDESVEDVRMTLAYLVGCGLAETSDDITFFFPYSVENTGSENASAKRVRDYRNRQKALLCNDDVTQVKRICNAEIEKEIEKEIEIEIDRGAKAPKHPTLLEVQAYCEERGSSVDPVQFYEYFNTPDDKGRTWMDSKGKPVKNWKQKIITWEKFDGGRKTNGLQRDTQPSASGYEISYD